MDVITITGYIYTTDIYTDRVIEFLKTKVYLSDSFRDD